MLKVGQKMRSIDASDRFNTFDVYTVSEILYPGIFNRWMCRFIEVEDDGAWYDADCFLAIEDEPQQSLSSLIPKNCVDEESRMRTILLTPSGVNVCKKCGAPKPCTYHDDEIRIAPQPRADDWF